jgi:hypothetical protein
MRIFFFSKNIDYAQDLDKAILIPNSFKKAKAIPSQAGLRLELELAWLDTLKKALKIADRAGLVLAWAYPEYYNMYTYKVI